MIFLWVALITLGILIAGFLLYIAVMLLLSHRRRTEGISYKMLDIADMIFGIPDDVNKEE